MSLTETARLDLSHLGTRNWFELILELSDIYGLFHTFASGPLEASIVEYLNVFFDLNILG